MDFTTQHASLLLALEAGGDGAWDWDLLTGEHRFSDVFKALLHYTPERFDAAFKRQRDHLHPDDRAGVVAALEDSLRSGAPFRRDYRLRCGDGRYRWFQARGQAFRDASGRAVRFAGLLSDLEPEKRREAREAGKSDLLARIARGAPLDETLERLVGWLEAQDEAILGSVVLAAEGRLKRAAAPRLPEFYTAAIDGLTYAPGVGSCGTAMATGERVIVTDIARHPYWAAYADLAARAGLAACWSEPIHAADGRVLGSFALYSPVPRTPTPAELALMEEAAHLAAIAIERAAAADAVRMSEARSRDFARAGGDWLWECDVDHRYTWVSASVDGAIGRRPEDMLGRRPEELYFHPEDAEQAAAWREHMDEIGRRAAFRGFRFTRNVGGVSRCTEASGVPFYDANGTFRGYRGISRDITREVELERAVAAADARLRAAIENLENGVVLVDSEDRIEFANARVREWSAAVAEALRPGQPFVEFVRAMARAGISPEAAGREEAWIAERMARHAQPGEPFLVERSDGIGLLVYEQRLPDGGMVTVGVDVSPLKRTMAQLRDAEQRFRDLFQMNPAPMYVVDIGTLGFVAVNQAALAQYGYTQEEFKALTLYDIRPREDNPLPVPDVAAMAPDALHFAGIRRHRRRDGARIDVRVIARRVLFDGRECMLSMPLEVTDQVRAERALRELNEALERRVTERTADLERALREMEALSYSISHDLRAPLRAINGFVTLIGTEERDRLSPEGRRMLERVEVKSRDMAVLIEDLLALFKVIRAAPALDCVDMQGLAREVAESAANAYPAATWRLAELPRATGDRALLRQVWSNLLDNAFKYSSKIAAPRVEIGFDAARGSYYVRDNGAGFDPQYADKLFGVFQRLHTPLEFPGTGVGLAIVARIVERHGGRAWAESQLGGGATFHFTLAQREPRAAAGGEHSAAAKHAA